MRWPVIVNDNINEDTAGDLYIFNTIEELRRELELWYVDEPYFAFDIDGRRLKMVLRDNQLDFVELPDEPKLPLIQDYLKQYATRLSLDKHVTESMPFFELAAYLKNHLG